MLSHVVRILLVEDEPLIASFVSRGLRAEGYVTAVAASGDEAVAELHEREWDLVVLDLKLPGRDGFSVLRELRADPKAGRTPVIVHTAEGFDEQERAWLEEHADVILDKQSGRAEELVAAVSRAAAEARG